MEICWKLSERSDELAQGVKLKMWFDYWFLRNSLKISLYIIVYCDNIYIILYHIA